MKILPLATASCLVLALTACPAPDQAPETAADLPRATEPGAATITPTPETLRVAMQPMAGSQATGEASLREVGAQTSVQLTVRGAEPNAALAAHVHQGACQQQGPVVAPLDPVLTDAEGLGTSVTLVDTPLAALADGRHYVQAHAPGEQPGPPVACADVTAGAQ